MFNQGTTQNFAFSEGKGKLPPSRGYHKSPSSGWGSFNKVFTKCVDKGMVGGHTQAIDSAMIKANASMDSLELKVPEETLDEHLKKVRVMSQADRSVKTDKASENQQKITATKEQLRDLKTTQEKWKREPAHIISGPGHIPGAY